MTPAIVTLGKNVWDRVIWEQSPAFLDRRGGSLGLVLSWVWALLVLSFSLSLCPSPSRATETDDWEAVIHNGLDSSCPLPAL